MVAHLASKVGVLKMCKLVILRNFYDNLNLVAGEIRELTNLLNLRNKNQEIREHIWEITENNWTI